ncbi:hypothetical protein [Leucobacter chromiiresistens]|uniref:Uncharacterized protein n=1 Tax=Leucobacter chromiiresistens TaxID=1079994 RepID=A0A1H0YRG7_9MICO|nr:hypothetical protein [Leucobacter chromiiresistens]SDQ17456.1 hypothetical protein SAMN04488565_1103 [Leucobacter chromiiresistens]
MSVTTSGLPGAITWARIEDDFFVGSRDGEFLGFIDVESSGMYVVCNQFSRPIGQFAELDGAMAALRDGAVPVLEQDGAA